MLNLKYRQLFQDEEAVKALTEEILDKGYVALPDFFDSETFIRLLSFARALGFEDKSIKTKAGTPAMDIARSDDVMFVFDSLHKARKLIEGDEYVQLKKEDMVVGFPQKNATRDRKTAETPFHFDAAYVNSVFCLHMPANEHEGNLFIYPNLRKRIRPRILSAVVARALRHIPRLRKLWKPVEVEYKVGSMNLFFGDITLHGVPPTTSGERLVFTVNNHW